VSRFLFVVPPLTGHVTPLVAVARHLRAGGHEVFWCGDPELIGSLAGPDVPVRACPEPGLPPNARGADLRGYAAVRFLWEEFLVPLADAAVEILLDVALRYRPDVIVSDMQALAGPLVAARLGIPWATSVTTSAPLRDPFAATPKVRQWLDGLLGGLIDRHGGGRLRPRDLELSPHLGLVFSTAALTGEVDAAPIRFVGPALAARPHRDTSFPWHRLDGRPLAVVTVGTVNAAVSGRFLTACAQALAQPGDVQGVIADPEGVLGTATPEVVSAPHLPMLRLLDRAAVVVCHAGHNTVCEALAYGVPLVVAPIRDDQPVIAAQVTEAGAGIRLRFTRATADTVGDAVRTVLKDPSYPAAAGAVKASFDAAGGAAAAAGHLLNLARRAGDRHLIGTESGRSVGASTPP
jgi:UDP:flavonoid glycosyltransferase YjiC (YdhE family)